jgi:hypothetical protein
VIGKDGFYFTYYKAQITERTSKGRVVWNCVCVNYFLLLLIYLVWLEALLDLIQVRLS